MTLRPLLHNNFFFVGLFLKLIAVFIFSPYIQDSWFVPFVKNAIEDPSLDPWLSVSDNRDFDIFFPYGVIMLLIHVPTTFVGWLVDLGLQTDYFAPLGFRMSLLAADTACLIALYHLVDADYKSLLKWYWLSPVVFLIVYWHGQTDIVPVALFFVGSALLFKGHYFKSAIVLACALSAKHSTAIALPFLFLYMLRNKRGNSRDLVIFMFCFFALLIVLDLAYFTSPSYLEMVVLNPEVAKLFWLSLDMGSGLNVPITPLAFSSFLYMIWRLKRFDRSLTIIAIGVGTNIVLLTVPAQPGWFLWLIPILAAYAATNQKNDNTLIWLWSMGFCFFHLIYSEGSSIAGFDFRFKATELIPFLAESYVRSFLHTLNFIVLFVLTLQILKDGIVINDTYKLSSKALVIGIAGDSSVGKTTLSQMLADVFGYDSVAKISGDGYHKWERNSPLWSGYTHLNPDANFIFRLDSDVAKLARYQSVMAQTYDHSSGRFNSPMRIRNRPILIVEGLHSLYSKSLVSQLDVGIFLAMDHEMKMRLKIKRDSEERGYDEATIMSKLRERQKDYLTFIKPQSLNAGLVFELSSNNNPRSNSLGGDKLRVTVRNGVNRERLVPCLVGLLGMQVDEVITPEGKECLVIQGEIVADDVKLLVEKLCPRIEALMSHTPKFRDGMMGLMQLLTIIEIENHFKRRIG